MSRRRRDIERPRGPSAASCHTRHCLAVCQAQSFTKRWAPVPGTFAKSGSGTFGNQAATAVAKPPRTWAQAGSRRNEAADSAGIFARNCSAVLPKSRARSRRQRGGFVSPTRRGVGARASRPHCGRKGRARRPRSGRAGGFVSPKRHRCASKARRAVTGSLIPLRFPKLVRFVKNACCRLDRPR